MDITSKGVNFVKEVSLVNDSPAFEEPVRSPS